MDLKAVSQVATAAPDGSDVRWLGALGHCNALSYGYTLPGGCDQMTCQLNVAPALRTTALNPGRLVSIYRGASRIWFGKLDEPVPSDTGWSITAHGSGTFGNDYMAMYGSQIQAPAGDPTASPPIPADPAWTADGPVNAAIARGLPWVNPGIIASGATPYMGAQSDPASVSVTDFLNSITAPANLVWSVSATGVLKVFTPPITANRILVATSPVPRTLHGYFTSAWVRYQASDDSNGVSTFGTVQVTNAAQQAIHGTIETFVDLTPQLTVTSAAAQATATTLIQQYEAASYAESFTVAPGQLLTMGGAAIDLGTEQAGNVYQVVLAAGSYGGEVSPVMPVTFLAGGYAYDEDSQLATITPFQTANMDMSTLISNFTTLHPGIPPAVSDNSGG